MQTTDAINILQLRQQNVSAELTRLTDENEALTLAISQLQGTLATQLQSLEQEKTDRTAQVDALTAQIHDLQAELETYKPAEEKTDV